MGVIGTASGHTDETREHASHVLEPVPPAHLKDDPRVVGRRRPVGDQIRVVPDVARGAVTALEADGTIRVRTADQSRSGEDRG